MIDGEREDRVAAVAFAGFALALSLMATVLAGAAFIKAFNPPNLPPLPLNMVCDKESIGYGLASWNAELYECDGGVSAPIKVVAPPN